MLIVRQPRGKTKINAIKSVELLVKTHRVEQNILGEMCLTELLVKDSGGYR